jgi:hypothetical protein
MDWFVFIGSGKRKELVTWTPEARWLFQKIVDEVSGMPGIRPAPRLRRPLIMVHRQIPVAGFEDGIAVRLNEERTQRIIEIPGCRLLGKYDRPKMLRGMVTLPWSAHEHWLELAREAIAAVPPR